MKHEEAFLRRLYYQNEGFKREVQIFFEFEDYEQWILMSFLRI